MKKNFAKKNFIGLLPMLLAFAALAFCLTGCGVSIDSITLPEQARLDKEDTLTLPVSYTAAQETTDDRLAAAAEKLHLKWSSSDEAVAAVDAAGLVTAVGPGEADILVSDPDTGLSALCHITVSVPLQRVTAADALDLVINHEEQASLDTALIPADATNVRLAYFTSDKNVATVDQNGVVTAVGNGSCVITSAAVSANAATPLTAAPEARSQTTVVTVNTAPASLALEDMTLTIGGTDTLALAVEGGEITSGDAYIWASNDEGIVTVDSEGAIHAVGIGTAAVTVTNEYGLETRCTVTVKNIVCAYCGQEGHGSGSCEKKRADEEAAARRAAEEAAAAQRAAEEAAQQQAAEAAAAQAAGGGGGSDGSVNPSLAHDRSGENVNGHYHGNGLFYGEGGDSGVCPDCGLWYSPTIRCDKDSVGSANTGVLCP